jgi:hypothetical protein
MQTEFWEKRIRTIEVAGILIAIGALFISMDIPVSNTLAAYALINIQLIWLIIITCSIFWLFYQLWLFFKFLESNTNSKFKEEILSTLSLLSLFLGLFLILYGWQYIIFLYKPILGEFAKNVEMVIYAMIWSIARLILTGIASLFKIKIPLIKRTVIHYIMSSFFIGILGTFIHFGKFTFKNFIIAIFSAFFSLGIVYSIAWWRTKKILNIKNIHDLSVKLNSSK